jgi:hypothetical protein
MKLSIRLQMEVANSPLWRGHNDDDEAEEPLLGPNVSPDLTRLVRLVESLQEVHPKLQMFWLHFGTTEIDFWRFRYPDSAQDLGHDRGDGSNGVEVDRGVTETAVFSGRKTASFTFYRRNVESVVD